MVGLKHTIVWAAAWVGLAVFLMFLAGRCLLGKTLPASKTVVPAEETLILDAGHGGEDGGAVSVTGARESDINLEVVLRLRDLLAFYGTDPVLLRETDVSLHSPGAVSPREKKTSDLKNRTEAVNHIPNATLLSIHQNSYPEGKYWGSQAFYAKTEGSQELAQALQTALREDLQPNNHRECKSVPDTVYLMNHVNCRAVLLECGFLTNPEEEARLRDGNYQKKLAAVTAAVWLTHTS